MREKLPAKGAPVFDGADLKSFALLGEGADGHYEFASATEQPFGKCIRVKIPKAADTPYKVQILTPTSTVALKKGDCVLAVFNARCIASEGGVGIIAAHLQMSSTPWTAIGHEGATVSKEWKRVYVSGRAEQDFPAGGYGLAVHLSCKAQTLELGGITLLNLGPDANLDALPFTPITYPGQEPDAPWRKAAAERIDKIRKGDLKVSVVGADGKAISGASVHMAMQRHAFGFGTFLEYEMMLSKGPDGDKLREFTLKMFNRCTTPIYWADWGWANPEARKNYLN